MFVCTRYEFFRMVALQLNAEHAGQRVRFAIERDRGHSPFFVPMSVVSPDLTSRSSIPSPPPTLIGLKFANGNALGWIWR